MSDDRDRPGASQDEGCHSLDLDLHAYQDVWMAQLGHLNTWYPLTSRVTINVPPTITKTSMIEGLSLLYIFNNLRSVDLRFRSKEHTVDAAVIGTFAELLTLQSLSVTGATFNPGADLGVLLSLSKLHTLNVMFLGEEGLEDRHMPGLACLTNLKSLSFRSAVDLTDEGFMQLAVLTNLTHLSVLPLSICVTKHSLSTVAQLPHLASLAVGLTEAKQVMAMRAVEDLKVLQLVVDDKHLDCSEFMSVCALCLRTSLVVLRLGTCHASNSDFILSLATLVNLSELKLAVAVATGAQPFHCDLALWTTLSKLTVLDLACTTKISLPLTLELVALLVASWPGLNALSLSVMGKHEATQEAVASLGGFKILQKLSLSAPLDHDTQSSVWSSTPVTVPVCLADLPTSLTNLVLELAAVSSSHPAPASEPSPPPLPPSRQLFLPTLNHLVLNECEIDDSTLSDVLNTATQLTSLELDSVVGHSDQPWDALSTLPFLTKFVLHASVKNQQVSHGFLNSVKRARSLRHLEWSIPHRGLTANDMDRVVPAVMNLTNLNFLSIPVEEGLWSRNPHWNLLLSDSLPMCKVSLRAGIVLYTPWDDYSIVV